MVGCWLSHVSVGTVSYSPAPLHSSHQRPLKAGIANAYSYWMACQIHLLIKNGAAPNELRVDTGMVALKPLLVDWVWESWRDLKDRTALIKKGWEKCGQGDVLVPSKQVEGLTFIADNMLRVKKLGNDEEKPAISVDEDDSDVEDETDESEEADVDNTMSVCSR